jgi:hypothetical protein
MLPSPKNTLLTTYTFERLAKLQIYDLAYYPFGSSMVSFSNTEFHYSFGMNTQEKDDEIYGVGNSYSAEYWQYDARLGRRWNNDPRSNPSVSVYACFGNNPIWFSDVAGDSNIVYLHVLSSAFTEKGGNHSWKDIDNYVTQTNGYFKKMGINMRMEVFSRAVDATKNALFDIKKMDNTDVVIAFGHHTEVKDWASVNAPQQEFPDFDKDALAESAKNDKIKGVPISDNPQNRIVLLNSKALKFYTESKFKGFGGKYSMKEVFGLTVLHELGHIATLGHGYMGTGNSNHLIMKKWEQMSQSIRDGTHDINFFLSKDDAINGLYLQEMRKRFYSSKPTRNY